jgi:hypothetical protein
VGWRWCAARASVLIGLAPVARTQPDWLALAGPGESEPTLATAAIVAALRRLNLRYLDAPEHAACAPWVVDEIAPERLLAAMASSADVHIARALVALFLEQPVYARHVEAAATRLASPAHAEALRLYYQAAVYLQRELGRDEHPWLPDLYSGRYGVPAPERLRGQPTQIDAALGLLAARHDGLSLACPPATGQPSATHRYREPIPAYRYARING